MKYEPENQPIAQAPIAAPIRLALALTVLCSLSAAAMAAPEVYPGVDLSPSSRPVLEGGGFAPAPIDVPTPEPVAPKMAEPPATPPSARPPKAAAPSAAEAPPATARRTPAPPTARPTAKAQPQAPQAAAPVQAAEKPSTTKPLSEPPRLAAPNAQQDEINRLRRENARLQAELARSKSTSRRNYEAVPGEHADSVARRLGLVARLILSHGRAYDYRAHTTRELREILTALEQPVDGRSSVDGSFD